jgi:hypothetical protein
VITSLTSITSELAKVQYLKDKAEDWEKAEKAKNQPKNETSMILFATKHKKYHLLYTPTNQCITNIFKSRMIL